LLFLSCLMLPILMTGGSSPYLLSASAPVRCSDRRLNRGMHYWGVPSWMSLPSVVLLMTGVVALWFYTWFSNTRCRRSLLFVLSRSSLRSSTPDACWWGSIPLPPLVFLLRTKDELIWEVFFDFCGIRVSLPDLVTEEASSICTGITRLAACW
jgi:hypothetical protein